MFQFQTGAIRSSTGRLRISLALMFQFQTGAIRSKKQQYVPQRNQSFNSKLVRLEGPGYANFQYNNFMFQFQTGAIRRKKNQA